MASETITRNDLKAILNEVLPPTKGFYSIDGRKSLSAGGSVTNLTSYKPSEGTWLVLTWVTGVSGSFQNLLQNRLPNSIIRSTGDTSISIPNSTVFEATGSNTVNFDAYATTACVIDWKFVAIKIK